MALDYITPRFGETALGNVGKYGIWFHNIWFYNYSKTTQNKYACIPHGAYGDWRSTCIFGPRT